MKDQSDSERRATGENEACSDAQAEVVAQFSKIEQVELAKVALRMFDLILSLHAWIQNGLDSEAQVSALIERMGELALSECTPENHNFRRAMIVECKELAHLVNGVVTSAGLIHAVELKAFRDRNTDVMSRVRITLERMKGL